MDDGIGKYRWCFYAFLEGAVAFYVGSTYRVSRKRKGVIIL